MLAPDAEPRSPSPMGEGGQSTSSPSLNGNYVFPASTSQERLWFLREFDARWGAAYHLPVAFLIDGPVDRVTLQRAVNRVVDRHEGLRTRLTHLDGRLVQVINPHARVTVSVLDLGHVPEAERWDEVQRLLATEAQRLFRFTEDSLLRVTLLRLSGTQHVLLATLHHIIADGTSVELFLRELAASYGALLHGTEPPLPDLAVQYADYVAWQRQWLDTGEYTQQRAYWVRKLAGAPLVLELPTDYPRPVVQTFRGANKEFRLSHELAASVRRYAHENGSTSYMVLLAAFAILLRRYSGQEELLLGTPVANRQRPELEPVIGFLANTLVVRADLTGDPTVEELLRRIRETTLEAVAHEQFPFDKIVDALQPERTLSRNPLFQVMFGLQEAPHANLELGGHSLTRLPMETGTSRFDLSLFLTNDGNGIQGLVEYSTDLFEAGTIDRLMRHYQAVVEGLLRGVHQRVSQLSLLTDEEHASIVASAFHAEPAPAALLPQAVEAQAARMPDRVALVCGNEQLTYGELNGRANRLARLLKARGVGAESRVAVCLERSPELLISLLAVLKAGGAYVPVDPQYPLERVRYMLDDAQACVLITRPELAHHGEGIAHVVSPSEAELAGEGDANLEPVADAEQLAYVLYTSGSTGRPKGVMIPHGALANFLATMAREPGLRAQDVLAAVTTFSFDIAALELYLPLVQGARVVMATREQASDGRELAGLLGRHGVTVMQATPATWRMLADTGWSPGAGFTVLCGGEALPQDLSDALTANGARLWNLYGPTETTVWSCRKRLGSGERVSLGGPIGNTSVYVLDPDLRPVPAGVVGELFIGGAGVARGYRGRPALTAERFVPDPFSERPGARLYRTGDLVRRRVGGEVEFIGRADHQVKVRGYRIELAEIEVTLRRHEAVRDVVALVWGSSEAERRLVSYVVPVAAYVGDDTLAQRLREHARASLPDYMVPSAIVLLNALPLTPNGKVDRRSLPDPRSVMARGGAAHVAPRTETESRVATLWMQLLGCDRVGIKDDFFELGGNSLLAGRLVEELDRAFGVRVPMRDLFLDATIANLASVIDGGRRKVPVVEEPHVDELVSGLTDEQVEALLNDPLLGQMNTQHVKEGKR